MMKLTKITAEMRLAQGKIAQNYVISIQISSTAYFLCH